MSSRITQSSEVKMTKYINDLLVQNPHFGDEEMKIPFLCTKRNHCPDSTSCVVFSY